MIKTLPAFTLSLLTACTSVHANKVPDVSESVIKASEYMNFGERTHRSQLKELTGIDPARTEWCAAFVNSVLEESGLPSNKNHKYPLVARSFLDWGFIILPDEIESGDIVIFPRGNQGWQGHVGFYVKTVYVGKEKHYAILGGNQNDKVSIELYPARKALGIRRDHPTF